MPAAEMDMIFAELATAAPKAMEQVEQQRDERFPSQIRRSIFKGIEDRVKLLESHGHSRR
jgi:hypothetical protein